jgi:two-component system sensor histidine kinase TctE
VRSHASNGCGVLVVEDSGPGIAEHDRGKVFDRFYRLDDKVAGTGLGLAIVRDIAAAHEATIEINTGENGVGTVISARFPRWRGKHLETPVGATGGAAVS